MKNTNKIKLDVLDASANAKLNQIYAALSGDNIQINATFPSKIDISGVGVTNNQLKVFDASSNIYLAGIANYIANNGIIYSLLLKMFLNLSY